MFHRWFGRRSRSPNEAGSSSSSVVPKKELPDLDRLRSALQSLAQGADRTTRKDLRRSAMLRQFGHYLCKDYNAAIGDLLKSKRLFSSTGKSRINDTVLLSTKPFPGQDVGEK